MQIIRIQIHHPIGLMRLSTDTGHEGLCPGVTPHVGRMILDHYAPAVIGADPMNRERIWSALVEVDRSRQATLRAYLDIALWDLVARAVNLPLFRYINGFRDRCLACLRGDKDLGPDKVAQQAAQAQAAGFAGYIITADLPVDVMITLLKEMRRALGDDFYLMLDGGRSHTIANAIRIGRSLDAVNAFRFDRPRPDGDLTGLRAVTDDIDTPVSAGAATPLDAAQVFAAQAADHLIAGTPWSGGITDVLKIIRCAEAFGALCHLTGIGAAEGFAHLQVMGAVKNAPFFEAMRPGVQCPSPVIRNPVRVEDGIVQIPHRPGLGIDLDRDALDRETDTVMTSP